METGESRALGVCPRPTGSRLREARFPRANRPLPVGTTTPAEPLDQLIGLLVVLTAERGVLEPTLIPSPIPSAALPTLPGGVSRLAPKRACPAGQSNLTVTTRPQTRFAVHNYEPGRGRCAIRCPVPPWRTNAQ